MRKEWNATRHENAYAVPGRWTAVELVPSKAVEALLMKLRIGNRAAFLVHMRLAECQVSFE
jgi:hypothetical protein